ncbi:MAG: tRNA lysidine(34) synthetase TilS [PVC group bacterium]|nr:tRNA lysidine(34) synthetase TilS [PVC group bacterium]
MCSPFFYVIIKLMEKIIQKITGYIQNNRLLEAGDRILVAVSGGSDSVFLLYILKQLQGLFKIDIAVAHVNHLLRGKDSDGDEVFVRKLSDELGFKFFSHTVDVKDIAKKKKLSLEDAARKIRYEFFLKITKKHKFNALAVAHNQDDQAETVLMRLLRGAGITGLSAMKVKRKLGDVVLIRPLLEIQKKDIISYLKKKKIKNRLDVSNLKADFFRNKVRLRTLPYLEKTSPGIKSNLLRLSQQAQHLDDFMKKQVAEYYKKNVYKTRSGKLKVEQKTFASLMPALRTALIRKIIQEVKGSIKQIDYRHIMIIDQFILEQKSSNKSLDLPQGLQVRTKYKEIFFNKK